MGTQKHLSAGELDTPIARIIIDRAVEVTDAHRAAALAHLQRRFQIKGINVLEQHRTLKEALSTCGIETATSDNNAFVHSFNPDAALARYALNALHAVAPYACPGGHLLLVTQEQKILSLRFDNAEILLPVLRTSHSDRVHGSDELDAVETLIKSAREISSARRHDLGYFQLSNDPTSPDVFAEAKCRYCFSSAWFRHSMREPAGHALTDDCYAAPYQGNYIPQSYSYEP